MTIFADQTNNTVFAGPDGSTGQPLFRNLTANDLPIVITSTSISAQTNVVPSVESYITDPLFIPANSIKPGDSFRFTLASDTLQIGNPITYCVKVGANGNTADANVYVAGGVNQAQFNRIEIIATVKGNTSSAPIVVAPMLFYFNGDVNGGIALSTIDTTQNLYFGMSAVNGAGSNGHFDVAIVERVS